MIGAGDFEGLDFAGLSLRALRLSMQEAVTVAGVFDSQAPMLQASAPKPAKPVALAAATMPRTGVAPVAGVRAPLPVRDDQELRRHPVMGGRGAGRAVPAVKAAVVEAPRPVALARTNLALGSQAVVVKLASHGGGRARTSALLTYQGHQGALALECDSASKAAPSADCL